MIKITATDVYGITHAIHGMRNPMESWDRSDSPKSGCITLNDWIGDDDKELMMKLAKAGPEHAKYRRMIVVFCDILAPLYWWKHFDTYKIGTVTDSTSTMHRIHKHEFTLDMFSHEHLQPMALSNIRGTINVLNTYRELYLRYKDDPELEKQYWWQMVQLLPSSYNQKRTVMSNYQVLAEQYRQRKAHKLDEWRIDYINWVESLPYSWIITGKDDVDEDLKQLNEDELEPVPSVDSWMTGEQIKEVYDCRKRKPSDCIHYTSEKGVAVCSVDGNYGVINSENYCQTCSMFRPISKCDFLNLKEVWSHKGDCKLLKRVIPWCDLHDRQVEEDVECENCSRPRLKKNDMEMIDNVD